MRILNSRCKFLRSLQHHIDLDDWHAVAAMLLEPADGLARARAELLSCRDDIVHQAVDIV
jgi:hypothetical protein